jgi:hypothetical protein
MTGKRCDRDKSRRGVAQTWAIQPVAATTAFGFMHYDLGYLDLQQPCNPSNSIKTPIPPASRCPTQKWATSTSPATTSTASGTILLAQNPST